MIEGQGARGGRRGTMEQLIIQWWLRLIVSLFLAPCLLPLAPRPVFAGTLPSLFRGIIVADSPLGVRVVSVEAQSQASLSDLRPEDVIVRIDGQAVRTIDDFAVLSQHLKGRSTKAAVLILRNGEPQELLVHLYSVPILRQWGLSFVPEHDIRFIDPSAAAAYWTRLSRGFRDAKDLERALNAVLNALHDDAANLELALQASDLLWAIARQRLTARHLPQALVAIQHGTTLLEHLFRQPLTDAQLQTVRTQLQDTLEALRRRGEAPKTVTEQLQRHLEAMPANDHPTP